MLLNAQCQTFLRDEAQRCLANKSAVHSARLLHRYGTSVTSEIEVEQLRRDPLPGPSSPLISATAICARSAPAAFSLSVVLLVDGLELIARYIPPLALIGAIGSIVHPLTVSGDGTTDPGGQSLSQNTTVDGRHRRVVLGGRLGEVLTSKRAGALLLWKRRDERYAQTVPHTRCVGQALLRRLQRRAAGNPVLRQLP